MLLRARLTKLRAVGDPMMVRKEEVGRREQLAAKVDKFLGLASAALESWPKSKPWLNATDTAAFAAQVLDFLCYTSSATGSGGAAARHGLSSPECMRLH